MLLTCIILCSAHAMCYRYLNEGAKVLLRVVIAIFKGCQSELLVAATADDVREHHAVVCVEVCGCVCVWMCVCGCVRMCVWKRVDVCVCGSVWKCTVGVGSMCVAVGVCMWMNVCPLVLMPTNG